MHAYFDCFIYYAAFDTYLFSANKIIKTIIINIKVT